MSNIIFGACIWKPIKKTEVSAIACRGKVWDIVTINPNGRVLIESKDKKDLRWINENQITKEC